MGYLQESEEPQFSLGARLKHQRKVSGLTMKQVAMEAGCSESMISKLENGNASPSLSLLHKLAKALGSNVSAITSDEWATQSPILKQGARQVVTFEAEHGIQLERLSHLYKGSLLQADIHIISPNTESASIEHPGEEIGYVLQGQLNLTIGDDDYQLNAGDSFHFSSHISHSYRNTTDQHVKVIWINTPATF